ncbi:MAG: VWA domain-containing protein [Chloroflexi bacterium]|nr:VWA domain-containing protein [Chloroflexota bacterium]
MRNTTRITVCLLIVFVDIFSLTGVSSALDSAPKSNVEITTEQQAACWGLDLIILVDQSYSMFATVDENTGESLTPSDPLGYRYEAVKDLLERLIDNRLDVCPEALHRIGVLAFGDTPKPVLSDGNVLTDIDVTASTDLNIWLQEYFERIDEAGKDRSQSLTDPRSAFQKADLIFRESQELPDPPNYAPRRHAVVMITDGTPTGIGQFDVGNYMCSLARDLNQPTWSDRSIWVVAMTAGVTQSNRYLDQVGCGESLGDDWRSIAKVHGGQVIVQPYNEQALQASIRVIVDNELGQAGEPISCGEIFYVDPYLQSLQLVFFRSKELTTKVKLVKLDEQGNTIYKFSNGVEERLAPALLGDMQLSKYAEKRNREEIVFDFPAPGAWRFEVESLSTEECQRRYQAVKAQAVAEATLGSPKPSGSGFLAQQFDAPYYDIDDPIPFVVRLKSDKGVPIKYDDKGNYPLTVVANLALPADALLPSDFQAPGEVELYYSGERSEWSSAHPTDPSKSVYAVAPVEGTYSLNITGTTVGGNGEIGYQAFSQTLTYTVKKLERFSFSVESPANGETLPCNNVQEGQLVNIPIQVSIQVRGDDGTLSSNYINSDLEQAFQAKALNANGEPLGVPIFLKPQGDTGIFVAELLDDQIGGVACEGMRVQVQFVGGYPIDLYTISDKKKTEEVFLTRSLINGVNVKTITPSEQSTLALHSSFTNGCLGSIQPVELEFVLEDLSGNPLRPDEVNASRLEDLYSIRLVGPQDNEPDLQLTTVKDGDRVYFMAMGGLTAADEGAYEFEITPRPEAFASNYLPAYHQPRLIKFERYDQFWTRPSTCQTSLGISGFLLAALVGATIYALTGGPGGAISIVALGKPSDVKAGPFRLATRRFFLRLRRPQFAEFGIKEIKYRKATGSSGEKAVAVDIIGAAGETLYTYVLEESDLGNHVENSMPLQDEAILYEK